MEKSPCYVLFGREFKQRFKGSFAKCLHGNLTHFGLVYHEGLNEDIKQFNPFGHCQEGGMYFAELEHVIEWFGRMHAFIADVEIPDDALVYCEIDEVYPRLTKFKANKFVLRNVRRKLKEFAAAHSSLADEWQARYPRMFTSALKSSDH